MLRVKRLLKGMLRPNPNLAPIINRSRIFNSYMSLMEIGMIIFMIAIAGRTNQSGLVLHFIIQSLIAIFAQTYVHFNHRLSYFNQSIKFLLVAKTYIMILTYQTL